MNGMICNVPQYSLWWYDFPQPIGKHMALAVSNNQFNMSLKEVMVAVVSSNITNVHPTNVRLTINNKQAIVKLNTLMHLLKSELSGKRFVGIVVDPEVIANIQSTLTNIFNPTGILCYDDIIDNSEDELVEESNDEQYEEHISKMGSVEVETEQCEGDIPNIEVNIDDIINQPLDIERVSA